MSSPPKRPVSSVTDQQKASLKGILPKSIQFIKELQEYDMERLFTCASTNWMLSTEEYRLTTSTPLGLIGGSALLDYKYCVLLLEEDSTIKPLDYREVSFCFLVSLIIYLFQSLNSGHAGTLS